MLGTILDQKYRIDRLLGEGGMGAVYAAEDVRSGVEVAVKVIHAQLPGRVPDIVARFEREARAAGGVDTEHIVRCLDAGTDPATDQPYMVLEYLTGEDLQRVLRRTGPLPPEIALRVVAQAAAGLAKAHEANIVHRDIKPANLFLAQRKGEGDERIVKILDFGVAKIRKDPKDEGADNDGLTRTGSMLGSPLYMSPEQARSVKTVDQRADIWSLGVVLYKAIAGRTPFDHISSLGDLVLALWNEPPPPVQQFAPWVSPEVAALLDRMLRVEPDERFQSMLEVLDALSPMLPEGNALREPMLVSLTEEARTRTAATFFRRFDTRPRPRTDPNPPRVPTGSPPSGAEGAQAAAARPGSSSDISVRATTGDSAGRGSLTENGLSSTDHGSVVAAPARRFGKGAALALALLGLGIGGVTALVLLPRGDGGSTAGPAATPDAVTATVPHPTVLPAPDPTTTASTTAAAATTATATATATTAATTTPSAPAPTARPKASGAAAPTSKPGGFTDFGDRK